MSYTLDDLGWDSKLEFSILQGLAKKPFASWSSPHTGRHGDRGMASHAIRSDAGMAHGSMTPWAQELLISLCSDG